MSEQSGSPFTSLFFQANEVAGRVAAHARLVRNDYEHALAEWQHDQRLSSAIRRDKAKDALDRIEDAERLAHLVLEAYAENPAGAASASIDELFVENRWCHKTGSHGPHNWSESGREFFCAGTAIGE